jgi:hypothetical protein
MAFTGSFMCSSFKVDLLCARHNFLLSGGHTFKISLYTNTASFTAATTAYTATNEITNTAGTAYTAGGGTLTRVDPQAAASPVTTAITNFANFTWSTSTLTNVRGALIYNDSATTPVADCTVAVLDFLADKSSVAGDFIVQFPTFDGTNAILRIA